MTLEEHLDEFAARNRERIRAAQAARLWSDAMNAALVRLDEQQRWLDAGLLATFRNWSNRR